MNQFNPSTESFYRPSGKMPFFGTILFLVLSFIAVTILGLIYGALIFYIPVVQLSAFAVVGYVMAVSYVLTHIIRMAKLRNPILIGLAVFVLSLYAEYVGWVAWIATFARDASYLFGFFFPLDVLTVIIELGKEGVWSLDSGTPKGTFLYLIWLVEALTVIGGICYATLKSVIGMIFCEESNLWVTKKELLGVFSPISNPGQVKTEMAQGIFSVFNNLSPATEGSSQFTLLELYECEHCKNFRVLNLDHGVLARDRRGQLSTKTTPIVKNLIISSLVLSNLKRTIEEKRLASLDQRI